MGLDIAILDDQGNPKTFVSLTVDEHWAIVQQAEQMALPLWTRMSDYYADVDYDVDEVSALAAETVRLQRALGDPGIQARLDEIERMLNAAFSRHDAVSVIAD